MPVYSELDGKRMHNGSLQLYSEGDVCTATRSNNKVYIT